MKRHLFFLSFVFVAFTSVYGQTNVYRPFPDSKASWSGIFYQQGNCDPPNYCPSELVLQGDTLINSKTYHKIYFRNNSYRFFYGGYREENKRIYFYKQQYGYEYLLYDFNITVGDTVSVDCNLGADTMFYKLIVESVDSVLLPDAKYRREINLYGGVKWIEGIGSTFGLLSPGFSCTTCICGSQLVCFRQNDSLFYLNESMVPCFSFNSVDEVINIPQPSNISPNPFTTSAQITFPQSCHHISLAVYDIQGKLMLQNQYAGCNQIQLNRSGLSNGMYFLKLMLDDKWVETKKIVVSE